VIRPIQAKDLPAVLGLWSDLMGNGAVADPRFVMRADADAFMAGWARDLWLRTTPFPAAWVADDDGVFAFVTAYVEAPGPVLADDRVVRIGDLYVRPHQRRHGTGRALVHAALGAARDAGYADAVVGTLTQDARAVAFWRTMGFGDWRVLMRR